MERDILLPSTPYGTAGKSLSLSACWGVPQTPGRDADALMPNTTKCGGYAALTKEKTESWALCHSFRLSSYLNGLAPASFLVPAPFFPPV